MQDILKIASIGVATTLCITGCTSPTTTGPVNTTTTETTTQTDQSSAQIQIENSNNEITETTVPETEVTFPIEEYTTRRSLKSFGEYIQDRFTGYHVADDIEFTEEESLNKEIPVFAIAEGEISFIGNTQGYGGVMRVQHIIDNQELTALYGHLDTSSAAVQVGETVTKGQLLANLGDHESNETDGERKHLHFGLYANHGTRINGYEPLASTVYDWINPQDFFRTAGLPISTPERTYNLNYEAGGDIYNLEFTVPANWEIEYIPSIQALNLFTLDGKGPARDRSQILIRYFDATDFLTLNTVTIHETTDLTVGAGDYIAKRYDIEKNANIADFANQPSWRNRRHIVTDFRGQDTYTRYFVVAANPDLDPAIYEKVLASMQIL